MAMLAFAACSASGDFIWQTPQGDAADPSPPSQAITPPEIPAFAHAPLTPAALRAHVERLASDEFEGREPGTRGEQLTVDYIIRSFQAAGLQPGVRLGQRGGVWEQAVPMVTATVTNNPSLAVGDLANMRSYAYGEDFVGWTKRLEPHTELANAELVFVGYGVVARDLGWNDYAGLDMHGKIAVILVNDPDFETGDNRGFRGRTMTYYGRWMYKFEEAARQGAAGALLIHEPAAAGYPWAVVRSSWTGPQHDLQRTDNSSRVAVEGWISEQAARDMFARSGLNFEEQKRRAQRPDFSPTPMNLHASVALDTTVRTSSSRNVIGVLPGRARPQEAVMYSAHWDHIGRCTAVDGDDICNGAVDNATGVAGLIELARRFAGSGRLQRSVVFVAFTAEESGLLGSMYYAEHPVYQPADTVALINMDGLSTLGMARDITLIGMGQNDLDGMLSEAARSQDRRVVPEAFPERGSFFRSDHLPLARRGVPVLYTGMGVDLYQGGPERGRALADAYTTQRYHKPDDEISASWDLGGAMRDLQLLYLVGARLGEGPEWPNWRTNNEFRATRDASRRGRAP